MTIDYFLQNLKNSKMIVECSACDKKWMLGDRERTEEEKKEWKCPKCREVSADYPIGGMIESYDIEREKEIMSPKDEPNFYEE